MSKSCVNLPIFDFSTCAKSDSAPPGISAIDIFSQIDEITKAMPKRQSFGFNPFEFGGLKINTVEPKIVPKMTLSKNVNVSDEFRADIDAWLLELFGTRDLTPIERGKFIVSDAFGFVAVRSDDLRMLSAINV